MCIVHYVGADRSKMLTMAIVSYAEVKNMISVINNIIISMYSSEYRFIFYIEVLDHC